MKPRTLEDLLNEKRELEIDLDQIACRRSRLTNEADRLKLIPDAVKITRAISEVEEEIKRLTRIPEHRT